MASVDYSRTSADGGFEHVERSVAQQEAPSAHLASPPQRRTTTARPRPLSMPPATNQGPAITQEQQSHGRQPQENRGQDYQQGSRRTSRTTVRVIGNYSLGKTLGAGSMGKVKLAYHNITGEKVCSVASP